MQSPLLKTPPVFPDKRRPPLLLQNPSDISIQQGLMDLLDQAEKDLQNGRMNHNEYNKLSSSLKELLAINATKNVSRGDPRRKKKSDYNYEMSKKTSSELPMKPYSEGPKALSNKYGEVENRPMKGRSLLPDVPPPPKPPSMLTSFKDTSKRFPPFARQMQMDTNKCYVAEEDVRWFARAKRLSEPIGIYEFVIDERPYGIGMSGQSTYRRINFNSSLLEVRINPTTGELFMNDELCYQIGNRPEEWIFQNQRHIIYFQGPVRKIWFDQEELVLRVDAPPQRTLIAGRRAEVRMDSKLDMLFLDNEPLCPLSVESHTFTMWGETHEIAFSAPTKDILINNEVCTLDRSKSYPCVFIKGQQHGIRFKGPPRKVIINSREWFVPTNDVVKGKIAGPRVWQLALGGPGHELIIDDMWYEIKFNGKPKTISIGSKMLEIILPPPAPEVEILGVMNLEEQEHDMPYDDSGTYTVTTRAPLLPEPVPLIWPSEEQEEQFVPGSDTIDKTENVVNGNEKFINHLI